MRPTTAPHRAQARAIGAWLRAARENASLSQAQAGDAIGIHRSTYSRVELGRVELSSRELATLTERFGLTLDDVRNARADLRSVEGALLEGRRLNARDTQEVA